MKTISMIGAAIVTLALISYGIGIFSEQRKKIISRKVLVFLTAGVVLDISATICMIIGSQNTPFTLHGFLGYSALLAMLTDLVLIWRSRMRNGINSPVSRKLHLYSRYAYMWWIIAYITGSLLVMLK